MTLNKFRGVLYTVAKLLGDVQAVKSKRKGAVSRRIQRRLLGKLFGKTISKLVR